MLTNRINIILLTVIFSTICITSHAENDADVLDRLNSIGAYSVAPEGVILGFTDKNGNTGSYTVGIPAAYWVYSCSEIKGQYSQKPTREYRAEYIRVLLGAAQEDFCVPGVFLRHKLLSTTLLRKNSNERLLSKYIYLDVLSYWGRTGPRLYKVILDLKYRTVKIFPAFFLARGRSH